MDIVALCIWREARNQQNAGMYAVASVIQNRAAKHKITPEQAVMVPWAFSSMTAHNDPQLDSYPRPGDAQFKWCQQLSSFIANKTLSDSTKGATLYYDDSIAFPASWNRVHTVPTVKIGRLNFFREV